jgi:hypothetical protein
MLIRVIYTDDTYDYLRDSQLDRLLEIGKVAKFQRGSGWVAVGVESIRTAQHGYYSGPERRAGKA